MNSREPHVTPDVQQSSVLPRVAPNLAAWVRDTLRAAGTDGVDPVREIVLVATDTPGDPRGTPPWVGLADRDTVIENLSAEDWHWNVKLRSVPAGHVAVMQFGHDGVSVGSVEIPDDVPHRPPTGAAGGRGGSPGAP